MCTLHDTTAPVEGKGRASIWVGGSLLIMLSALIAFLSPKQDFTQTRGTLAAEVQSAAKPQISWRLLQTYDYKQGKISEQLEKVLDKTIMLPGFAVPLDDAGGQVSEFLFVPNQMACIHVPAPPPHLIVHVRSLKVPLDAREFDGPLWLTGVLKLEPSNSIYGSASFVMDGAEVSPYH